MKIIQTSETTFEMQNENGCTAWAGFAVETMGSSGVYLIRTDCPVSREQAERIFRADPRVAAVITTRTEAISRSMRERAKNAEALVASVCAAGLLVCLACAAVVCAFRKEPTPAYSVCEQCGEIIGSDDHGQCKGVWHE